MKIRFFLSETGKRTDGVGAGVVEERGKGLGQNQIDVFSSTISERRTKSEQQQRENHLRQTGCYSGFTSHIAHDKNQYSHGTRFILRPRGLTPSMARTLSYAIGLTPSRSYALDGTHSVLRHRSYAIDGAHSLHTPTLFFTIIARINVRKGQISRKMIFPHFGE